MTALMDILLPEVILDRHLLIVLALIFVCEYSRYAKRYGYKKTIRNINLMHSRCKNQIILVIAIILNTFYLSAESVIQPMKLADFVKLPSQRNVLISPDGKHLSLIYKKGKNELLAILDRKTLKPVHAFRSRGNNNGIGTVHWVSNTRLIYSVTKSFNWDKQLRSTGELVGVNIDGSKHRLIFGYQAGEQQTGSRIKKKQSEYGSHEIIDLLKDDEKNILIAFYPWKLFGNTWRHNPDAVPRVYKLNVRTGAKRKQGILPIAGASGIADIKGEVRFAIGTNDDNEFKLYYKESRKIDWEEFNVDNFEGKRLRPLSFSADNNSVYLTANVSNGTRALYRFNLKDKTFEKLFHDQSVDISSVIKDFSGRRVVGVGTDLALPEYHYLDKESLKVKLHKVLKKTFMGHDIVITSSTEDSKHIIVYVYSDANPGDYYLFDSKTYNAQYLLTRRPWIELEQMLPMESIKITTRDDFTIHGYLTKPKVASVKTPLIVLPHGGPHGVRDYWGFDWEAQLLASRGYAVLQVNYRGSGGFGIDFQEQGYGKWGTLMQDDITDATRAVIDLGIVDPERICIYGASYGGYAALMGVVKEPELYKCAIGSMGVYDLPMMFEEGDISERKSGLAYLRDVLGDDINDQKSRSPVYNVDKISAEILLIHGAKDERAPIEQAESLKSAFDKIKKPYEWLEMSNEGHGYYDEANRLKVYSKILDFLDKHIGDTVPID